MRKLFSIAVVLSLAFIFMIENGYSQEPEKAPKKGKTSEKAEREYLEKIRQLEYTLQREKEQQYKQQQHQLRAEKDAYH